MNRLNYKTLEKTGCSSYLLKKAPEKVIQFGEGNFLRAFADCFIDLANEKAGFNGKVVVVSPVHAEKVPLFYEQDCLYTLCLKGIENGRSVEKNRIISAVSCCLDAVTDFYRVLAYAENLQISVIISNTTEAGIVFCKADTFEEAANGTFPAKLTRFLYARFCLSGVVTPGFILLPCELIEENGNHLRECVEKYAQLWALEPEFLLWLRKNNVFCNTLVDRIVPGFPKDGAAVLGAQLGYEDRLIDVAEPFGFWAIEYPVTQDGETSEGHMQENLLRCFEKAGLPVLLSTDISVYRKRKVLVLNGAHSAICTLALLCGVTAVSDCLIDSDISTFLKRAVFDEIIPAASLPEDMLTEYANAVFDRFSNPFIRHELISISLNTTSKWRTRVLPSVKGYFNKNGRLPGLLLFGFASNLVFGLSGMFEIKDDSRVLDFFQTWKDPFPDLSVEISPGDRDYPITELAEAYCARIDFWGEDLTEINGFKDLVCEYLWDIYKLGERGALRKCIHNCTK